MAGYVDRFLRFPHRAAALAFAAAPPFAVVLGETQTAAAGPGWALMELGAAGVLWSAGVGTEIVGEDGERTMQWQTEPQRIEGYHVNFTISESLPRSAEILAAIDASGFRVEAAASPVQWARAD